MFRGLTVVLSYSCLMPNVPLSTCAQIIATTVGFEIKLKYTPLPGGPQDLRAMQPRGGSVVVPDLRGCLHGQGLWHGGLYQRSLWRKLEMFN